MSGKRGFALLGITTVVVMISILTAVAAPDYVNMQDKTSRVKANMCIVQLAFEDFAVRTDGRYPTSATDVTPGGKTVEDLCPDIDSDGMGEWPINPFTGSNTVFVWGADPSSPGGIGANPAHADHYVIRGCGRDGRLLLYELTSGWPSGKVCRPAPED